MRSINEVLKLFTNKYNMDYCEDFDIIKGVMEYCNENLQPLEKIQFRGGNETIIKEIVERIKSHLVEKLYYDSDKKPSARFDHEFRKITFFLVLNTDATFKYNLKDDQRINHVLEVTPQLPKCLLIYLIWGLSLDKYFYEILAYSPCWFSFQFIEPAVASMKHLKPYEVLEKVEYLVKSTFTSICRADFSNVDIIDKKRIFEKFYDYTMELLRQFYTPDIEKFSDWTKREFFKYSGYALRHLLDMVLYCFDLYEEIVHEKVEESVQMYSICTELCSISMEKRKSYTELVRENQMKIIIALLNSLQYNVMLVTIDVFMHWVEEDVTSDLTLQAAVGERAYQVLDRMTKNKKFGHDVQDQLKFIVIKPRTLEEIIKEATIGIILRKLDDNMDDFKEKQMWFNELINRPLAFGNDECLETIRANAKLITVDNLLLIIDYLKLDFENLDEMLDFTDEHEEVITIVLLALQNFNADQLYEINVYKIKKFGIDSTVFEQSDLSERTTEFFNKWVETFDLQEFLRLFFENPRFLFEQFLSEACNSEMQIKNFCSTILKTRKLSKMLFEDLLKSSINSKYTEKFYPNLMYEFYQTDIIDKEDFFRRYVYNNVVDYLDTMNLEPLLSMLKALVLIANKSQTMLNFAKVTAPVLIMAGQILEKCRWDMISYSDLKEEIVRLSIDFIQTVSRKFLPVASEKDKNWITEKVSRFRPINQYYFQKYSLNVAEQPKTFDKFLHPSDFENKSEIEKFLTSTYIRCTAKESEWLVRCDQLRLHLSDVVLIIEGIVNELGNDALCNFRHCIVNYANIVRKFMIPAIVDSHENVSELGFKILNLISGGPIGIYDEMFMIFQSILLEVFQQAKPIKGELVMEVNKFVSNLKDCKGKEIFREKFQAIAIENLS